MKNKLHETSISFYTKTYFPSISFLSLSLNSHICTNIQQTTWACVQQQLVSWKNLVHKVIIYHETEGVDERHRISDTQGKGIIELWKSIRCEWREREKGDEVKALVFK